MPSKHKFPPIRSHTYGLGSRKVHLAPTGRAVSTLLFSCVSCEYSTNVIITDFEVKYPVPGLNLTNGTALPRSFAGNIPVDRPDHPNNTLFFWGFERQGANSTLTAPAHTNNTEPWIIWLQGG